MVDQNPFLLETLSWQQHISFLAKPQSNMWSFSAPNPCMSFSIWTIHRATNGSTSRFHLKVSTPSYPLNNMLSNEIFKAHHAQILSCFSPRVGTWFIVRLVFPAFQLFFPIFSIAHQTRLGLPHPSILGIFWCICTHPIGPMGIHL